MVSVPHSRLLTVAVAQRWVSVPEGPQFDFRLDLASPTYIVENDIRSPGARIMGQRGDGGCQTWKALRLLLRPVTSTFKTTALE